MKNLLTIAYNGGAYGTYLQWAINSLVDTQPLHDPYTSVGNSHNSKFKSNFSDNINLDSFLKNTNIDEKFPIIRLHPKDKENPCLKKNLESILNHTSHLILIYPDRSHELFCVCNYMTKIWKTHHYDGPMKYIDHNDIYKNYTISCDTELQNIPLWIQREHMSFNLFSSWHDQVEWYFPDVWSHERALIITTKDLLENFQDTMKKILRFWNKQPVRDISDLLPLHNKMLSLQTNLGKDQHCQDVIDSVLNNNPHWHWGELCLPSQAWIQYQLRSQGYELMCQDLNHFPTNTTDLKAVTYKL